MDSADGVCRPDGSAIQRHLCSGPPRPPESPTSPSAVRQSGSLGEGSYGSDDMLDILRDKLTEALVKAGVMVPVEEG